jgi:hypothetical protein
VRWRHDIWITGIDDPKLDLDTLTLQYLVPYNGSEVTQQDKVSSTASYTHLYRVLNGLPIVRTNIIRVVDTVEMLSSVISKSESI